MNALLANFFPPSRRCFAAFTMSQFFMARGRWPSRTMRRLFFDEVKGRLET
jgi:hypothetical protein